MSNVTKNLDLNVFLNGIIYTMEERKILEMDAKQVDKIDRGLLYNLIHKQEEFLRKKQDQIKELMQYLHKDEHDIPGFEYSEKPKERHRIADLKAQLKKLDIDLVEIENITKKGNKNTGENYRAMVNEKNTVIEKYLTYFGNEKFTQDELHTFKKSEEEISELNKDELLQILRKQEQVLQVQRLKIHEKLKLKKTNNDEEFDVKERDDNPKVFEAPPNLIKNKKGNFSDCSIL